MKKGIILGVSIFLFCACVTSNVVKTDKNAIRKEVNTLLDTWHKAASDANFKEYFGVLDSTSVYIGTAAEEIWTKEQFANFSKPYFDKGKAWDFKASNRIWSFSKNGKIAWFDEDLATWMRGCRGSGILIKKRGEWKIAYYNLTVLIENEKMDSFIELRDQPIEAED